MENLRMDDSSQSNAQLRQILKDLNNRLNQIEASAVITTDGLIRAEQLGTEIDHDRFGAMCATLLSLAKRAVVDTARGELKLVLIEGSEGSMLVVQIGHQGVLALAARPKSQLGMIFVEARKTAQQIAEIL